MNSKITQIFCGFSPKRLIAMFAFLLTGFFSTAQYVNGGLSTGATATGGTAAPAGFTWSELQGTNTGLGSGANISANLTLADDFTVPAGQTWNITKITFYAYSTGYAGATSPFNDTRVRIFNTNPSVGTPTPVFGNLTTNRFSASSTASMYRIGNATPGTTRQIWKIEATVVASLPAGTYWIEWQHGTVAGVTSNFSPAKTVVGSPTQPGNNALQHDLAANTWTAITDGTTPAAQDFPFIIDYTATGTACTPQNPGATSSTAASVCPAVPFTLSAATPGTGVGISYQWQSSPNGTTWTDIPGATNITYTTTQTAATYYRLKVTCAANTPDFSTALQVNMSTGCYCAAGSTNTSTLFEKIANVTFGTINNSSTVFTGYSDYTGLTPVANFVQGGSYPISITGNANIYSGDVVKVWIDFNQNGSFTDPGEDVYTGGPSAGPYTGNVVIPSGATLGNTRMRVRLYDGSFGNGNTTPCGDQTYGEVEDYKINIVPCVPITVTAPANATASCGGSATFTVNATGSVPAFVWQYRTSATGVWLTVPNAAPFSGVNTNSLTVNPAPFSFNGYEFRVSYSGACTGATPGAGAVLTVTPFTLAITPSTYNVCATGGTAALITIPNSTNTVSFVNNSAQAIPDGNTTGITKTFNVTGITGVIQNMRLIMNATHPYASDIIYVLKAPNGAILNLSYAMGGTGPAGANLVNTAITSVAGAAALSSGTAPWTGTFRPDAQLVNIGAPTGPTGFDATVANFTSLYSVPNGTWTLAMYDYATPDAGTFNSATLEFTYGAAPATAVFTPATGLFTNAAATIPYTAGSSVSQVYALPATQGANVYSAVLSTATCSTAPQTITVNVNTPVTGPAVVANRAVCAGSNAVFSVTGLGGGPAFSYQWQVSTSAVPAFTNIGGATGATFTVAAATVGQSGNQYRVIVTGAGCAAGTSITSSAGTLTVNTIPVVVISAAPNTQASPTSPVTLTAAVSSATAPISYQWYLNTVLIPGATGATFTPDANAIGEYTVSVTDANGCAAGVSSPISINVTRGATDPLFIYPSPNSGVFQVRYYNATANATANQRAMVNVYDQKGSRVFTHNYVINGPYAQMNVDLGLHAKGIYRVELTDALGNRLKTGTVMVF